MIFEKNLTIPLVFLLLFGLFYLGKFLLIPLFFSIFIFIILKSISKKISSILIFNKNISYNFSLIITFITLIYLLYFVGALLNNNISKVISNSDLYQNNLYKIFNFFKENSFNRFQFSINEVVSSISITKIFTGLLNSLSNLAGNFSLIILYLIFIIIEENFFKKKIHKFTSNNFSDEVFSKINHEIFNYFQIKTLTSLLTGTLTFGVLFYFNSDLSIFFGITAFVLNFIPFLGSLISILLPFLFSLLQFFDPLQPTIILILLFLIQLIVGNFIEPKLMGKSLNLSPLIMLIFLSLMSKLWGLSGMFLSVPILVILLIILSKLKSTKKIAILLSEKGEIS